MICFKLPISRTFFDFPWRFELSGVHCNDIREKEPPRTPLNPNTNIHTFRGSCVGLRPTPKIPVPPHAKKTSGTQGNSPYVLSTARRLWWSFNFRYSYDIYVRWDGHMQYLSLLPLLRFSGYFQNGARGRAKPRGPRVSSATKHTWFTVFESRYLGCLVSNVLQKPSFVFVGDFFALKYFVSGCSWVKLQLI